MGLGFVQIAEIRRMLDECAPGHEVVPKLHHDWIKYENRTFQTLPLGDHASRSKKKAGSADVKATYVIQIARALKLPADCVRKHFAFA